jgi:hypothetical protein
LNHPINGKLSGIEIAFSNLLKIAGVVKRLFYLIMKRLAVGMVISQVFNDGEGIL